MIKFTWHEVLIKDAPLLEDISNLILLAVTWTVLFSSFFILLIYLSPTVIKWPPVYGITALFLKTPILAISCEITHGSPHWPQTPNAIVITLTMSNLLSLSNLTISQAFPWAFPLYKYSDCIFLDSLFSQFFCLHGYLYLLIHLLIYLFINKCSIYWSFFPGKGFYKTF